MHDNHAAPADSQHPLTILTEIEQRGVVETLPLEESSERAVILLTEYLHALGEPISAQGSFEQSAEMHTFDEGHAGGCG
ncbi:DUF6269 family protein [Streptomyces uncialis]|uniref:DUF6269 family protein n=1 Tax=Streptomyces uncialis TaxID=1048205 RepID=UPI0038245F64